MKKTINLFVSLFILFIFVSCSDHDADDIDKGKGAEVETMQIVGEIAFPYVNSEFVELNSGIVLEKKDSLFVWEGDILLSQEQVDILNESEESSVEIVDTTTKGASIEVGIDFSTGALGGGKHLWKGKIPYTFDSKISISTKNNILSAIQHWEEKTKFRFVYRTNEKDYIEFINGEGNWSYLGKQGKKQQISVDLYGGNRGSAIHEIGHAIGLLHEQCKANRDNDIIVHYNNIQKDKKHNFDKRTKNYSMTILFDFNSIMLYSSYNSFSIDKNKPTMTRKDGTTWTAQRSGLSEMDIRFVNNLHFYGNK